MAYAPVISFVLENKKRPQGLFFSFCAHLLHLIREARAVDRISLAWLEIVSKAKKAQPVLCFESLPLALATVFLRRARTQDPQQRMYHFPKNQIKQIFLGSSQILNRAQRSILLRIWMSAERLAVQKSLLQLERMRGDKRHHSMVRSESSSWVLPAHIISKVFSTCGCEATNSRSSSMVAPLGRLSWHRRAAFCKSA